MAAFRITVVACLLAGPLFHVAAQADVFNLPAGLTSLEIVPVGNPGNVGKLSGTGSAPTAIVGGVAYEYRIGKYEVTAAQYCEFLNAVAKTDTHGLYMTYMAQDTPGLYGCKIQRAGSSGSYTYSVASDWANRPVNWITWGDAARFVNWLHNGQPTGSQDANTTEDGSYALNGAMTNAELLAVTRKANATWVIPSEDEWYKAAYHKNDGVTGNYFDYPTSSNSMPSNILGNPTDPGNNATYYKNGYTVGSPYYRTQVGDHENSESPYGTYDQGGNVTEWNEAVIIMPYGVCRGNQGGSFYMSSIDTLHGASRNGAVPSGYSYSGGFRVVQIPEPGALVLLVVGAVMVLRRRIA